MCYETNLTEARWEILAEFLEDGRKRQHSLRTIVDAILYITKTGCQWRYLPKDFPKWQLVYYYFRKFETTGLIEIIHDSLREQVRHKKGQESSPSLGLVDSQSVKTASVTREKGIDGNKKVNGRKRFILTDTLGLLMGIIIVAANVGERSGAEKLFQTTQGKYPRLVKVLADGRTEFAPSATGKHQYLVTDPEQKEKVLKVMEELVSAKPVPKAPRFRRPVDKKAVDPAKAVVPDTAPKP